MDPDFHRYKRTTDAERRARSDQQRREQERMREAALDTVRGLSGVQVYHRLRASGLTECSLHVHWTEYYSQRTWFGQKRQRSRDRKQKLPYPMVVSEGRREDGESEYRGLTADGYCIGSFNRAGEYRWQYVSSDSRGYRGSQTPQIHRIPVGDWWYLQLLRHEAGTI